MPNSYDEWGEERIKEGYIMEWPTIPGTNIRLHEGAHVLDVKGRILRLLRLQRVQMPYYMERKATQDQCFNAIEVNSVDKLTVTVYVSDMIAFIPKDKVATMTARIQKDRPGEQTPVAKDSFNYKFNEANILDELREYIKSTYNQHYAGDTPDKVQALELIIDSGNGKGFLIGDIIKYAARYTKKGSTPAEWRKDLIKTAHYSILMLNAHDKEHSK